MKARLDSRNRGVALRLGVVVLAMFGFGFALVPIYDVFCEITGLNGKTGAISERESLLLRVDTSREVTVEFTASVNGSAGAWEFRPTRKRMTVNPGTRYTAYYAARNLSDDRRVAQAVPSVAPAVASRYFNKAECFCFTRQDFAAQEQRDMPLTFVIDPDLPPDVDTVTLSYTFFRVDPA